jgi:hypothetical protein
LRDPLTARTGVFAPLRAFLLLPRARALLHIFSVLWPRFLSALLRVIPANSRPSFYL